MAKLTEKGKEYLKKYEVSPEQYIKQEQKAATLKQEGETAVAQTPPEAPAQAQVQEAPAQAQAQEAPAQAQAQEAPAQAQSQNTPAQEELKYNPDAIDWETLQNLGVSRESLEKRNLLEPLLKGYKTNELVPISFNLGSTVTRFDARLSLREVDGKVAVAIHGMRKEPQLDYPFFGHEFSEEDKKNLLTTGNMGRTVELTNSKTQEKIPSIISIDKLTNEIIALRSEHIKVPDEIKGVKLSQEQKQTLKEGKPLFVEGMTSKKGEPFNATVQFNADKRYVEFLFEDSVAREIATIVGATEKQDGYLLGNDYAVTWALGHLVQLALPEAYGCVGFHREHLPILPRPFILVPKQIPEDKKGYRSDPMALKQLKIIDSLFKKCSSIIVATDAGREGELIFRYIYEYLQCQKPFQRLWISSLTEKGIKTGLANLQEGSAFDLLYASAQKRSEADWLVGINATQALSIAVGEGIYS